MIGGGFVENAICCLMEGQHDYDTLKQDGIELVIIVERNIGLLPGTGIMGKDDIVANGVQTKVDTCPKCKQPLQFLFRNLKTGETVYKCRICGHIQRQTSPLPDAMANPPETLYNQNLDG